MYIREATNEDLDDVLKVERLAFGQDEEADLVRELLEDPTARPLLSLLAFDGDRAVGHILFTSASLIGSTPEANVALLAPMAVVPDMQRRGIGGSLIRDGLTRLEKSGVDAVFVLGHPEYYPRYGFEPAGALGYEAPYPIPVEHANAWMMQALRANVIGSASGKVVCADAVMKPKYWVE